MSKRYSLFICLLFCGVIAGFGIWNMAAPSRQFSPQENRMLAQRPALTAASLFSGEFTSAFEEYVTDQFVLRDGWVVAKAALERASGKGENNSIYYANTHTLIARLDAGNVQAIDQAEALAGGLDVPVYFALVPGKSNIWADKLPLGAPNFDEDALLQQAARAAGWIDLAGVLRAHADEYIYYRLDPHWTSLGAYYGYTALAKGMGHEPVPLDKYTPSTVSRSFVGTEAARAGAAWLPADSIDMYVPGGDITVRRGAAEATGLYDYAKLDTHDQYAFFLGGNTDIAIVHNPEIPSAPKLLLVRDSFADCLVPFLAAHYEIHLLDTRYYRGSVEDYARDNDMDAVLVLYSTTNLR